MHRIFTQPLLLLLVFLTIGSTICGCASFSPGQGQLHHASLFRTSWDEPFWMRSASPSLLPTENEGNVRKEVADAAWLLLDDTEPQEGYGTSDINNVLLSTSLKSCGRYTTLKALVDAAGNSSAYQTTGLPSKGDILLFHNQVDENRNGAGDDWYTGAAVVVSVRGKKVLAITRTTGAIRKVVVSPDGPMVHTWQGETVNSFVRRPSRHDAADAEYLAGQLYAGYIDIASLAPFCAK